MSAYIRSESIADSRINSNTDQSNEYQGPCRPYLRTTAKTRDREIHPREPPLSLSSTFKVPLLLLLGETYGKVIGQVAE
jgi:hypothetical protein